MMSSKNIYPLIGKIQNYAWGGTNFLSELLHVDNSTKIPMAEYWMGAHPSAPSLIEIDGKLCSLNELIKKNPDTFLGKKVMDQFGELPYLFKVLDVKEMLSIQVHPSKTEAEKGFDVEESKGISLSDSKRNYKDRNHKPEIMIALSEFWLLHGFLVPQKLEVVLQEVDEFKQLAPIFKKSGYRGLYQWVMEMPQNSVDEMLRPLISRIFQAEQSDKSNPEYWVQKLYNGKETSEITDLRNIDRGIFSIYFFNIVNVQKGEGIFQGAGVPHAYLEGQNMELMANSDNVLRGGLTPKHIDVTELLKHTTFEGIIPNILRGDSENNSEINFPCPVPDFGITELKSTDNLSLHLSSTSMEIIFVTEGHLSLQSNDTQIHLSQGQAAVILAQTNYQVVSSLGCIAFKAFVPL